MTGTPAVIQIDRADDVGNGEDRAPRTALVVGKIDRLDGLLDSAQDGEADHLRACHVPGTAELPGVDHVTDPLFFVGKARAVENFDSPVLAPGGAAPAEGRNKQPPPMRR